MFLIKDAFSYYKNSILFATAIYFLSIVVGIIIFHNEKIPIAPQSLSFLELFLHNSLSVLLIIVVGLISLGILGNLVLIANGIILGRIFAGVFNNYGLSPLLNNIAPHFIFETLAILIATAISCETFKFIYNIKHNEPKVIRLRYCIVGFCLVILLLIFSALIESQLGG